MRVTGLNDEGEDAGNGEHPRGGAPPGRGARAELAAPRLHTVEVAARLLGIGRTTMYGLLRSGEVTSVKLGRRTLVPDREIERVIDRLMRASRPDLSPESA